ncbi:MAG TPA: sigma factor [Sedimentisphaerales bacterium]|nr:sigma factor [Sedimentisphaerales bacterium]
MLEDKLIIREFNRGNRQALHRAYEKYKEDLMTLATALLYDKNAAEDVVQDVFVSLIKSAARGSAPAPVQWDEIQGDC